MPSAAQSGAQAAFSPPWCFSGELFDVLRQEGERQGAVRKAREAVLDAFLARFDRVPAPVEKVVAATDDLALLKEWLRAVIRAQDPVTAEVVFTVRH